MPPLFGGRINPAMRSRIDAGTFCQVVRKPWHRALTNYLSLINTLKLERLILTDSDDLVGRTYRIRTCDTLTRSQVDIFQDFSLFSKLESA